MKKKRLAMVCAIAFLFILVLPVSAGAEETSTLRVEFPHIGTQFVLYHLATADASGNYVATEAFKNCPVNLGSVQNPVSSSQAPVLESYAMLWEVEPTAIDSVGWSHMAHFFDLEPGLYLLTSQYITSGGKTYRAQPVCLPLPATDPQTGNISYEVIVSPKEILIPMDSEKLISQKAIKVWDDNGTGLPHPDSVTVHLLRNGMLEDTQILNEENSWTYLWEDLEEFIEWSVVEEPVADYTVHIEKTGTTYVVTNTRVIPPPAPPVPEEQPIPGVGEEAEDTLPQTGMLWWPVPLLAAAGMLLFVLGWMLNRRDEDAA